MTIFEGKGICDAVAMGKISVIRKKKKETERKNITDVNKEIELQDITYKYPNTDTLIFNHADMTIPVGAAVGIVGSSGAGKSTIVDVMLGLLVMQEGKITADGQDIFDGENYRKWLKNVGYIPQTIFMIDDTIRKNVAFGIPEDEISEERIWEVLKEAQQQAKE